jgi:hypothetical protein
MPIILEETQQWLLEQLRAERQANVGVSVPQGFERQQSEAISSGVFLRMCYAVNHKG